MQKVSQGQKFSTALRADTWNAFIDAAQDFKERRHGQGGEGEDLPDDTIVVRNDSDLVVPQYGVLWVQQLPADKTWELPIAVQPTCPFISQIAIAAKPMAADAGTIGRVWIAGVHPVRVEAWEQLSNDGILPCLAVTQANSFALRRHGGSWGVPIIAKHGTEGLAMARLPIVPPPMVRIRLTDAQRLSVYGEENIGYFDAGFLAFPDSELSQANYYGLSVE